MKSGLGLRLLLVEFLLLVVCITTIVVAFEILGPARYALYEYIYSSQVNAQGQSLWGPNAGQVADNAAFMSAGRDALVIAAIITGSVGLLTSIFVVRRVARPLRSMALSSQRMANGDYSLRVSEDGLAEIGELGHSFNRLGEALQETEHRRRALIADVAHELRTPLVSIEGYMEGLLDGVVPPDPDVYERVRYDASRLRRLVVELEELSRVEEMRVRLNIIDVSLPAVIESAIERLRTQFFESTTQIEAHLPPDLPPVRADPDRLLQILLNLIGNALRYTPDGGCITVSAVAQSHEVCISVRDNGIGIAPEHIPHIFDRFYRVDKARSRTQGGSGVGLAIARSLVEAQGGRIWVESRPGVGSTFSFTLPQASYTSSSA